MKTPKKADELIAKSTGQLDEILQHIRYLQRLTRRLRKHLPPDLGQHCQVGGYHQGILVLITDSPAWSTLLRYRMSDLLDKLRQESDTRDTRDIRIRISPLTQEFEHDPQRPPVLSGKTASLLRDVASSIQDTDLKAALLRLSCRSTDNHN